MASLRRSMKAIWLTLLTFAVLCSTAAAGQATNVVFCCRPANDLYRAASGDRDACPRFDSPAEAVEAAAEGSGVLILADGYPQQTTVIEPAVLAKAAEKKLRLYVEYPAALPALKCEATRGTHTERAVVHSDFFGPALPPLRILAINGLQFVPIAVEDSHMVAARVAGFDTAVFGLPEQKFPLLFEHPQGNLLVATTQFSRFVTGRYAPQDAWQAVWRGVFRWLTPGAPPLELKWTPAVRARYGRQEPLPADAEEQALKRGTQWFIDSKLLLDRSRLGDNWKSLAAAGGLMAKYPNGLAPTPSANAPVGDGSLGILEAPLSVIQADGSQLQGVARRGDCTGESAMALAFGGKALGNLQQAAIARNLLDFWYFTSDACKRERGDPKHGAYGLIAWGIDSPAWYRANYGDDNARLLLGTLAAAALLEEDRWDEPVMRCLLANLRTTGQLGFRGDRIDIPALSQHGWEPLFLRRKVNYLPHMEAYLWACYLWAYEHTGCDLFRERAKTAIRMTMARYPDGWTWMNGLAQEKARILLPLAWLVRLEDTPEHRRWLRQAVEGLVALQDASGAIREQLGQLDRGRYPPPRSNEAYGTNEASLIQENGDPVSDLLYTTNFAFLGLHEAAAAGDSLAAEAEEKLAAFLCRIQVQSDAHPSLDGGWFRAFDFKRWEPWGSNADAGWGAWAIESGWTQGWIVSVFGMREMDTSLWELTGQSGIARHFEPLRKEMLPDEVLAKVRAQKISHAALDKRVSLVRQPHAQYPGGGASGLTDGVRGTADHGDMAWLGFHGVDFEAVVDLGEPVEVRKLAAGFLRSHRVGVFLPPGVEFAVSDDGRTFREVARVQSPEPDRDLTPTTALVETEMTPLRARFVRVRATNYGKLPGWVTGGAPPAWLFIDEIVVNP